MKKKEEAKIVFPKNVVQSNWLFLTALTKFVEVNLLMHRFSQVLILRR